MKEPILEPLLRGIRLRHAERYLAYYPNCRLLDIGCGREARLLRAIKSRIAIGRGIDFKAPQIDDSKIKTISARIDRELPFEDSSFDLITILAVL